MSANAAIAELSAKAIAVVSLFIIITSIFVVNVIVSAFYNISGVKQNIL
jgi:hypothetical protein